MKNQVQTNKKPFAVFISDIHFSLSNLKLASAALRMAADKAKELKVPLIIAGDLHDTKAIIRGEVANELINIFQDLIPEQTFLLVGNHDLLNERSKHNSLNFLSPYCQLISFPTSIAGFNFIPYQTDSKEFLEALHRFPKQSVIIAHQGFLGAHMGEYIVDKTSVAPEDVKDYMIITGHYHRRQTLGTVHYIGSPYTISFAEANDPEKGFIIVNTDRSLDFVPTNLRKHVIIETTVAELEDLESRKDTNDLYWLKVTGTKTALDLINKKELGKRLFGHSNFKLDKIPIEEKFEISNNKLSNVEMFDLIIDSSSEPSVTKTYLKTLWRELCS